jgi:hypothetical protein
LEKIALEDEDVCYMASVKIATQTSLSAEAVDDKDWKVRLILKIKSAFDSVPTEHRERLMKEVLPAIRVLINPAVVSEVGEIVSIGTEWNKKIQSYSYVLGGSGAGGMPGEIFTCSIKVQKLPEPLSHTWETSFPERTIISVENFIPAEINAADLLTKLFNKITNKKVLADIARNDKDSDVRKAAVEKLTDQNALADIARNEILLYVRDAAENRLKKLQGK